MGRLFQGIFGFITFIFWKNSFCTSACSTTAGKWEFVWTMPDAILMKSINVTSTILTLSLVQSDRLNGLFYFFLFFPVGLIFHRLILSSVGEEMCSNNVNLAFQMLIVPDYQSGWCSGGYCACPSSPISLGLSAYFLGHNFVLIGKLDWEVSTIKGREEPD